MGRNNADFHGITGRVHFTDKNNRASIERHGLRAQEPQGADPIDGVTLRGVYAYNDAATAHQEEANGLGSNEDIWAITLDRRWAWDADPYSPVTASYTTYNVLPHELKRVGHTVNNKIHWHPEEHCKG